MRNLSVLLLEEIHTYAVLHTSTLKTHKKPDTYEKPHPVLLVESHSPPVGTLKHMKSLMTHSGKKLHTCDTCEKSFARSSNLKVHKKMA